MLACVVTVHLPVSAEFKVSLSCSSLHMVLFVFFTNLFTLWSVMSHHGVYSTSSTADFYPVSYDLADKVDNLLRQI